MNILLAPMHGMTDAFYRNTYAKIFGSIDTYYTPFIGTTKMRKSTSLSFKDILPTHNSNLDIVPQLLSNNSSDFNYYASCISDLGYNEINWNIGCPFHKVARKKKGSGILPHPDLIKAFLDDICSHGKYDLSIKMRLGYENKNEGLKVIQLLNDYPLKNVTIHGRVGTQLYNGKVDLDSFEELYTKSTHKVIYNGDIFGLDDYKHIQTRFPNIHNYMIGRGALNNPFLASSIKGISYSNNEKVSKLTDFHKSMFNYYQSILDSEIRLLSKMKEFWVYLSNTVDPSGDLLLRIRQCKTLNEYHQLITRTFNQSNQWITNF